MGKGIILNVDDMPLDGIQLSGELPVDTIDLNGFDVQIDDPVRYDLMGHITDTDVIVTGNISVNVVFRCVRCAVSFPFNVIIKGFQCVRELVDNIESVDLTSDIREAIILAFPNYPVCEAECKGLCGGCGKNLNKEKCDCVPPDNVRWGALDNMDIDREV